MASFGKGVEYAIHCLLSLPKSSGDLPLDVGNIAEFYGVSRTYLAKIFTRLKKAGIVRSSVGAKGGYELARPADHITFWDIVVAVEGEFRLFECRNIRENIAIYRENSQKPDWAERGPCTIHKAMMDVEEQIKTTLQEKNLAWLMDTLDRKLTREEKAATIQWFSLEISKKK